MRHVPIVIVLLLSTGCVIPTWEMSLVNSNLELFDEKRLAFLQPGRTTEQEVVKNLGKPHRVWRNDTNFLYWGASEQGLIGLPGIGGPLMRYVYLFFVEFDASRVVKRYELKTRTLTGPFLRSAFRDSYYDELMNGFDPVITDEMQQWDSRQ